MPSTVPSLDLLQVFEACARCRGFTAAAQELGMTQPAVSQHIRRLEQQLGTSLFSRVHRGAEPTAAGLALLGPVQQALVLLHDALHDVDRRARDEVVTVATDFAFAACWLVPRLGHFYTGHPRTTVSLVTSNRVVRQLPADVDAAIVFGDGRVARAARRLLWREQVFPVCSPALLARHGGDDAAVLHAAPRLALKNAPGQHWFDWPALEAAWGTSQAPPGKTFDNYPLVLEAALAGDGVAIGWRQLVDRALQQGLLHRLAAAPQTSGLGYHLVQHPHKRRRAGLAALVDWLDVQLPPPADATVDCGHG